MLMTIFVSIRRAIINNRMTAKTVKIKTLALIAVLQKSKNLRICRIVYL